jgi:D-alanyl-D-alanine carboxypeptidase/D-alanyl-D-alanine-endopeptidase (penicillin-binding protein 4)
VGGTVAPGRSTLPLRVTLHDPPAVAGNVLAGALRRVGVSCDAVERSTGVRQSFISGAEGWRLIAVHETRLRDVIALANKRSVNLYAECVARRAAAADGAREGAGERTGSIARACAALRAFALACGADADEVRVDDASGLSRQNRVSASAVVAVLRHMHRSADRAAFVDSLAVGGVDGTLLGRFEPQLRGRVFAKSGYVRRVGALSGYLLGDDQTWYAFSILMNDVPPGTNPTAKQFQDQIVQQIESIARELQPVSEDSP